MRFAVAAVALLCACSTPPSEATGPEAPPAMAEGVDRAGNRIEALVNEGDRFCDAQGDWCIMPDGRVMRTAEETLWQLELEEGEPSVWPYVVFVGGRRDHALFGTIATRRDMYSGGGASMATLSLHEVAAHSDAVARLLDVQLGGQAMIRACFGERDEEWRNGACHDEYGFGATLNLDTANTEHHPRFIYVTSAATFPGRVSRDEDNRGRRLRDSDLVWARDEECSYRRVFTLVLEAESYLPDAALPACTDYQTQ